MTLHTNWQSVLQTSRLYIFFSSTLHHLYQPSSFRRPSQAVLPLCCSAVLNQDPWEDIPIDSPPLPRFHSSACKPPPPHGSPTFSFLSGWLLVMCSSLGEHLVPEMRKIIPVLEPFPPYSICLESSSLRPLSSWLLPTIPEPPSSLGLSINRLNEPLNDMDDKKG